VAARRVLAVAADTEARVLRQCGQQHDQSLRGRRVHLRAIFFCERRPPFVGERLRGGELEERRARREVGQPEVEVVEPREILLLHAPRRPAHGAQPDAFPFRARRAESNDAYRHYLPYSASVTFSNHFVSPPKPTLTCTSACVFDAPCQCAMFGPV